MKYRIVIMVVLVNLLGVIPLINFVICFSYYNCSNEPYMIGGWRGGRGHKIFRVKCQFYPVWKDVTAKTKHGL